MATLTGFLYACLAVYGAGWYFGKWSGNFSLLLFILTSVTSLFWLAERLIFLPRRQAAAVQLEQQELARRAELDRLGIAKDANNLDEARWRLLAQPWWLDWTAGLFPVILLVFLLRSFLFEPFKIPSGSMMPTLEIGDLILVNKYHYGVRLPVVNKKIIANNEPQRGDVMVFRWPVDTGIDFIKRVVAVPGDEISYRNQQLYINGKIAVVSPLDDYYDEDRRIYSKQFVETLPRESGEVKHRLLVDPTAPSSYGHRTRSFPNSDLCRYSAEGVSCKVPPGQYFMMGDNRDNSEDSRYWGFVPDENIVGRAFLVWMNFSNLKRIGRFD
jgi:signal peptidase I